MKAHAYTLVYADVQRMVKRLRKDNYDVRYIVAGEYGSKKGRAHWHMVLFFNGKAPICEAPADIEKSLLRSTPNLEAPTFSTSICEERNMYWKYWPHGVAYFEKPEFEGFRYIMKYALKGKLESVQQGHLAMSKKPPLGFKYFQARANQYVEQGLAPQSPEYEFRHDFDTKTGKRRKYWLQGRMRELFVGMFLAAWEERHGTEPPYSDFIEGVEDKWVREEERDTYTFDQLKEKLDLQRPSWVVDPDPNGAMDMEKIQDVVDHLKRSGDTWAYIRAEEFEGDYLEDESGYPQPVADLIYLYEGDYRIWRAFDESDLEGAIQTLNEWAYNSEGGTPSESD